MTFNELYEYGMKSAPAKVCIPQELVQSLMSSRESKKTNDLQQGF